MAKRPSIRFHQLLGILFILVPLLRLAPTASAAPLASLPPQSGLGELPWSPLLTFPLSERTNLNVNLANGNLMVHATDFAIRGTGQDLVVDRYYNSLSTGAGVVGQRWTLSVGSDVKLLPSGNTVTFVGPSDAQFVYTANGSGGFTAPPGIDAMLSLNHDGSYTLTFQGTGERDNFTGAGALASEVDKDGNTISFAYNANGASNTITDTQGRTMTFSYSGNGNYLNYTNRITDSSGRYVVYSYGSTFDLTGVSGLSSEDYRYTYDTNNRLANLADPDGANTSVTYDGSGRVASITFATGAAEAGTYAFTYNAGNTVVTDPNNHAATYSTDSSGRLTKLVDALSNTFQWSWTSDNHVAQYTDGKNQAFLYGYDANNNLSSVTLPTGAKASAVYGTVANIPSFFVPTSAADFQGNTVSYGHDGNGDVTTITDQLPSQNQTQLFYNASGTVDHVVDARGNTTGYSYDSAGNLTKITPPSPMGATTIVPDALSRPASVTDGKGQQRAYTYDYHDHVQRLDYSGTYFVYTHDGDGNLTSMQPYRGAGASYTYDHRNRLTQQQVGSGSYSYQYDAASNLTSLTDAATVPGSPLTVTYGYNAANQVTSLQDPSGTTSFLYDQDGRRTNTTYPDGVVMAQSYDNSERLQSIAATHGGATLSSFSYSYSKPGGGDTVLPWSYSETLQSPSGSVASVNGSMTYDAVNLLSKWLVTQQGTGSVVHDYVYQYDGTSNRTQILADPENSAGQIVADPSQGLPHSNENDLSYANPGTLNQIVAYGASGANPSTTTYTYDAAGNQTGNDGAGNPAKALALTYLSTNQTKSITNTSQEPVTMTWVGPGQRERVSRSWTDSGTTYTEGYTYTPLGLAGRTSNAPNVPASSYFVRDPYGTPVAERNSDGTEYYYLFDGQGNVVALEDPGTVVGSYDYCPTGNEADLGGGTVLTQAALNNPLRQGAVPYDDNLKDYFGSNGVISEDYSGVGTQTVGMLNGDVPLGLAAGATLDLAYTSGRTGPSLLAADESCDSASNPEESTADQEGCSSQETTGEASASAGGGEGEGSGAITALPGEPEQPSVTLPPRQPDYSAGTVQQDRPPIPALEPGLLEKLGDWLHFILHGGGGG